MNTHETRLNNNGGWFREGPTFEVFGIYETARDLAKMHCASRELAGETFGDYKVFCDWFDFKELHNQHLARKARQAAEAADVILLAANTRAGPRRAHKEWVERCVSGREIHQLTIEVPREINDYSNRRTGPLRAYLRGISRHPRARLLSRFAALDPSVSGGSWIVAGPNSNGVVVQLMDEGGS